MAVTGWRGVGLDLEGAPDVVEEVLSHLPPFYRSDLTVTASAQVFEEQGAYVLEVDGERPSQFVPSYPTLLDIANLVELTVVERLPDLIAVHAGAVALDGRALLLPGRTQTGKSRLVAALLDLGATYLSDEFALLDDDGNVHPYPRLLALRDDGAVRRVPAASLGSGPADSSHPVAAVAFVSYADEVRGLESEQLNASGIWLQLMEHCISVHRRPDASFRALTTVAARARGLSGRRGDASAACSHVSALLAPLP